MIFQDGQAWLRLTGDYRVPYVFDNLIYRREMPVTIAVFINPGRTPEQPEASAVGLGRQVHQSSAGIQRARRQIRLASSPTS